MRGEASRHARPAPADPRLLSLQINPSSTRINTPALRVPVVAGSGKIRVTSAIRPRDRLAGRMRSIALAATSLILASAAGCTSSKDPAPAPLPPVSASPASPAKAAAASPAAVIVFNGIADVIRTVGAAAEDGSAEPVSLSAPGVDTTFAGALPGRRALLAEHKDAALASLAAARVDTGERASLGALPAGKYADVAQVKVVNDVVAVELSRADATAHDVFALRAGAEPRLLAEDATLAAAAAGRVAVLAGGDLQSLAVDGSSAVALGGGDGQDLVTEVRGDRILLTLHAAAGGDVRAVGIDGSGKLDVGAKDADEAAVGFAGDRLVFLRRGAAGAALVSTALDGTGERTLTDAALDARPIQIDGDQIFFDSAAGALHVVAAGGGAPRLLDAAAGTHVRVGGVRDGQVVYTCDAPHWPSLRVAKLDGTGAKTLLESPPALPFFGGILGDRVVYYRSLAGQIEGGRLFSVKLDGTEDRAVGTTVTATDGKLVPGGPADQDFEAITPSGRLVIESEMEAGSAGSQLLIAGAETDAARVLTATDHVRFAAVIR